MGLIQHISTELAFGSSFFFAIEEKNIISASPIYSEGQYNFLTDILTTKNVLSNVTALSLLTLPRLDLTHVNAVGKSFSVLGTFCFGSVGPKAVFIGPTYLSPSICDLDYATYTNFFLTSPSVHLSVAPCPPFGGQGAWLYPGLGKHLPVLALPVGVLSFLDDFLKGSFVGRASFFANISFFFLFFAMTIYWFDLVFTFPSKKLGRRPIKAEEKVGLSSLPVGSATIGFVSAYGPQKAKPENAAQAPNWFLAPSWPFPYGPPQRGGKDPLFLGKSAIFLANISLISLLCIRWKESGHFPLSNLYESLIFLSWSCTFIHLFLLYNNSNFPYWTAFLSAPPVERPVGGKVSAGPPGADKPMPADTSNPFPLQRGVEKVEEGLTNPPTQKVFFFGTPTIGSADNKNFFEAVGQKGLEKLLGSVLAPCALLLNAFATFSLPKEMQQAGPLVPALQSNWLMMHVTVMIISYAALLLGSLLSIAYLIYINTVAPPLRGEGFRPTADKGERLLVRRTNFLLSRPTGGRQAAGIGEADTLPPVGLSPTIGGADNQKVSAYGRYKDDRGFMGKNGLALGNKKRFFGFGLNLASNLDYLSYRIIGIGFPFLTIGILSGAVWANEAWGSYWSWDPKETWALLTWLIFAIYLHTRLTKGWQGERPALIASLGFVVVWICYLGVNLLGEGLHSYGFLNN